MPILINNESGYAENVGAELAQQGTHSVPLINPEGQHVTAPYESAAELLSQGYRQPNTEELTKLTDYAKYSTPTEQLKTGLEAGASALTLGTSRGLERAILGNEKEQLARQEVNPVAKTVGEIGGLGLGLATGVGAPEAMVQLGTKVGLVAEGLFGASKAAQIGSAAVKAAAENAIFQSGDEVGKMLISDPNQTIGTAASNVGLSALIGAGIGAGAEGVAQLWKMGPGKNIDSALESLKNRSAQLPTELKTSANLEIAPALEAALSDNPAAKNMASSLVKAESTAGKEFQAASEAFHTEAKNATANIFNKTEQDIANLSEDSLFNSGKRIKENLIKDLDAELKPIKEKYAEIEKHFKDAKLFEADKGNIADAISKVIEEQGLHKSPSSSAYKLSNRVLNELPLQETAEDLRNFTKNLRREAPFGSENYQITKDLIKSIDSNRDAIIERTLSEKSPQILSEFKLNQKAYANQMQKLDILNDRLHVGKYGGPSSFIQALKEMDPETLVKRMSPKGDVQMQELLKSNFPSIVEDVKQNEINRLLKSSKKGDELDINKLYNNLNNPDKFSPELRKFILDEKQINQLNSIKELIDRMPTAKGAKESSNFLDKVFANVPPSAAALVTAIMGHNPAIAYGMAKLAKYMHVDAPDAIKLGMLKFMASNKATSSAGLKSYVELAAATLKGEAKINKAVGELFKAGKATIFAPDIKSDEKLKKQVEEFALHPEKMLDVGSHLSHYGEEHQGALAHTAGTITNYLAQIKPKTQPLGLLNKDQVPSKQQEAEYNRAITIANNPGIIISKIKEGTLNISDMKHFKAMYPDMYNNFAGKIQKEIINAKEHDVTIPYKTRMSMSLFMGQPLDSSMQPQAIQSNQPQMNQQQMMPIPKLKNVNKLDKLAPSYATPVQSREMHRASRH